MSGAVADDRCGVAESVREENEGRPSPPVDDFIVLPAGTHKVYGGTRAVLPGHHLIRMCSGVNQCLHRSQRRTQFGWNPPYLTDAFHVGTLDRRATVSDRGVDGGVLLAVTQNEAPLVSRWRFAPSPDAPSVSRSRRLEGVPLAVNGDVVVVAKLVDQQGASFSLRHVGQ